MRQILVVLLSGAMVTVSLAVDPIADELLAVRSDEFLKAAAAVRYGSESGFFPDDLVALADKALVATIAAAGNDKHRQVFSRYFEAACDKAGAEQLRRLVQIYARVDPSSFHKQWLLPRLAPAWILDHLDARAEWPQLNLPPLDTTVPANLAASPDLVEAWQLYKRTTQPFDRVFRRDDRHRQGVSFQANERSFYRIIDDVLQKRGEQLPEQLAVFEWSGMCGTGSDSLAGPQSLGTLMALLNDGRISEAVGAAVRVVDDRPLISAAGRRNARIEILSRCGLDWEAIFAGAQLDSEVGGSMSWWRQSNLQELAAFGSDRGAALIIEMARRTKPEHRETYARALSILIAGGTESISGSRRISGDLDRNPSAPLSAETKARVLTALQSFATTDGPPGLVREALVGIARARSPETKATVRALLKHRSANVARSAADVLRSLGERVEAPRAEPVRFQVSFNGAPVPTKTRLHWEIKDGKGGSLSSSSNAGANGTIGLDREHFTDPERKITAVTLSGEYMSQPAEGPYFFVTVPVPENLDAVTRVDIRLVPVQLRIDRLQAVPGSASAAAIAKVQRREPKRDASKPYVYVYFDRKQRDSEVPIGAPVVLQIQPGLYDLEVLAPGAEKFASAFEVTEIPSQVDVELKAGGDVRFDIVRPDGERDARFKILSGGKEVTGSYYDYKAKTHRGLSVGSYILHIPSSAELLAESRGRRGFIPLQAYAGRDIPFTIRGNSPEALDLGEIPLKRAGN